MSTLGDDMGKTAIDIAGKGASVVGKGFELAGKLLESLFKALSPDVRLSRKNAKEQLKKLKADAKARKHSKIVGETTLKKMQLTGKSQYIMQSKLTEEQAKKFCEKASKYGFMCVMVSTNPKMDEMKSLLAGYEKELKEVNKKLSSSDIDLLQDEKKQALLLKKESLEKNIESINDELSKVRYQPIILKEDLRNAEFVLQEILREEQYKNCVTELEQVNKEIYDVTEKIDNFPPSTDGVEHPDLTKLKYDLIILQNRKIVLEDTISNLLYGEVSSFNDMTVEEIIQEDVSGGELQECESFERAVNRFTDRDYSGKEPFYVVSAKNPNNYVVCTPLKTYQMGEVTKTETQYDVYVDGKSTHTYNDNQTDVEPRFWLNLRSRMKSELGIDKNDRVFVANTKGQVEELITNYNQNIKSQTKYNDYSELIDDINREVVTSNKTLDNLGYKFENGALINLGNTDKVKEDYAHIEVSLINTNEKLASMVKEYSDVTIEIKKYDNVKYDSLSLGEKNNLASLENKKSDLQKRITDFKERKNELKSSGFLIKQHSEKSLDKTVDVVKKDISEKINKNFSLDDVVKSIKVNDFNNDSLSVVADKVGDINIETPDFDLN